MQKSTINNVRLGLFVLIGIAILIVGLYMIGNNQNLFESTFRIRATFNKVNGLTKGNNVRFSGINVGTVKNIQIASDTTVDVVMIIESDARKFIKKTATASVGTDGLMGNKLVEINNTVNSAESVQDGDVIATVRPIETDQMMRTLNQTNKDLSEITAELKGITKKVNNSGALWKILGDTMMAEDMKQSFSAVKATTRNAAQFTKALDLLMQEVRNGKGMIGYLTQDTIGPAGLKKSLSQIQQASDKASQAANDFKLMTEKIKRGEGGAGILLSDSAFANDLSKSMRNIRISSAKLDQNMDAMKHNFLFRGYFKDLEKEEKKAKEKEEKKK